MISIIQVISVQLLIGRAFVYGSRYDDGTFYGDQRYLGLMRNRYDNRCREEYSDECDYRGSDSYDSDYRDIMVIEISNDYEDCREICRPPPECKPMCRPPPECKPVCRPMPKCVPICKPVHHKKRNNINRGYRGQMNLYIQLIQRALVQGSFEIHKLSRCYLEDVKTRLIGGLQLMWKTAEAKAVEELKRFEKKLFDIIISHNKNILRDTEAMITSTNGEISDDLVVNLKTANKDLIKGLIALSLLPPPPPPEPNGKPPQENGQPPKENGQPQTKKSQLSRAPSDPPIPLALLTQLVNSTFADLIDSLPSSFKKLAQSEKNVLQKVVNENRNGILNDVSKLISDFEQKLSKFFIDLAENEVGLIRSIMDQSSRKLLCDLEHVIHQIGQNIISILKGCNTTFRPQCLIGPQYGGWTNVGESELLYN